MASNYNEPVKQQEVSGTVLPATFAAALRYLIAAGLPFLVAKDIIPEGSTESVIAIVTALATAGYGLYKTFFTKKQLVQAADAAPDSRFIVK